jgi:predicted ATPase
VDLTRTTNGGDVPAIAAEALGVDAGSPPLTGIEGVLLAAPALVVLDNCEHVLEAAASLVDHLLTRCLGTSVLATSRAALRVSGEDVVSVAPLSTEPGGAATELFVDRARAAHDELSTDDDVLDEIAALTDLLDGVPLAIELAAARAAAFSVGEILALLRRDLAGLGDARRPGPDRHRTLSAAITWSLRMVSDDERRLLSRLAVLPGSFRLVTALVVGAAGADDARAIVAALSSLVEQSLIVTEHRPGPTRYRLLEMIRAVAQEGLTVADRQALRDRLLDHCVAELAGLDGEDLPSAGIEAEIARDQAVYVNAVEHALATEQTELGLRLVHDLFPVWHGATQRSTLDRWMTALLAQTETPTRARAAVLRRQAIIASEDQGDYERAFDLLDLAEADATAIGDRQLLGRVRATRAGVDYDRGHLDALEADLGDAIALLEETGDNYAADALITLASVYVQRAQFLQADESLMRAAGAHPHWSRRIMIEQMRAWNSLMWGQIESAASSAAATLDMAEQSENTDLLAGAVEVAAYASLAQGETELSRQLFVRMVAFAREHELPHLSDALAGLATVSALGGDLTVARSCRDELRGRPEGRAETLLHNRLRCAFVDLAAGDIGRATIAATDVVADADRSGEPYAHLLALELLAACVATDDPQRARALLAAADEERTAVGAKAWPFEPYRQVAARTLDGPDR